SMLRFDARAREKGYIATPSYTQVIEPVNARSIGHWHQYRKYFEPVLPILAPMLEHWGYPVDVDQAAGAH
ncbi:MAG TPA: sulfotransferase family protein, partial [Rhodanobacteraceae bacterium]|nr:sulfotransferase family protein [Rhodanobacteraceae bacterium]